MIGRITVIIKMFKWFFILFPVFNLALLNDHSLYNHLWEGLLMECFYILISVSIICSTYDRKYRCTDCKRIFALKRIEKVELSENELPDETYKWMTERNLHGKNKFFLKTYVCRYCGKKHTRINSRPKFRYLFK